MHLTGFPTRPPRWGETASWTETKGAIHSTKISGNFGPKLNGSVRSNRKSFEKTGPPFEVVLFSRSDRSEFWLNGSRPRTLPSNSGTFAQNSWGNIRDYFIGILFELYTIKSFSEGFFLFSWLAVFPVTDFDLCNLELIAKVWFVISWLIFDFCTVFCEWLM